MSETTNERWNDLDAVRALALLLGVALHGVMSFMTPRIWLVGDTVTSTGADVLFYVIHMFRMTTFFVLAGFFARLMMQKKGVAKFISNRLKRVALPLLVFWPIVLAAIIAVAIIANAPGPGAHAALAPPPALSAATFPLTHLWFLYDLLLLYAGAVAIKLVTDAGQFGGRLGRLLDGVVGVLTRLDLITLALAAPVAIAFSFDRTWMMWFGITSPDTGLIPSVTPMAGFVTAFVFGWWLNRRTDLFRHLSARWGLYALSAVAGTWWCLTDVGKTPSFTPVDGRDHLLYAVIYPLTSWCWAFFLIGFARVVLKKEHPMIRRLSDASYWIYIIHVPVLLFFQYLVMKLNIPIEYKFGVVLFGTFGIGLSSYQMFVRYSFIGTILNGRKRKIKALQRQEALA